MAFFEKQVVFITGSTGGLGGCLLYKLCVVLGVPKIYVLTRRPAEEAIVTWATTMPGQVGEMLCRGSIHFVRGDITKPGYGIEESMLRRLENEVTIVINAAANIHLKNPLRKTVMDNCLSALELASMATKFKALSSYVQVSTAYALGDLPDGPMEERFYPIADPEQLLRDVLSGKVSDLAGFQWPYGRSKRIMECLLHERHSDRLPLLLVRPTGLGPAIKEPCEMYMPHGSSPVNLWISQMLLPRGGTSVFPATKGSATCTSIFDEIPVDLASNIILQHVERGTRGVVHTSSQSYVPKTFDDFVTDLDRCIPPYWKQRMPKVVYSSDPHAKLGRIAKFFMICNRDWLVRADRSLDLDQWGPVGLDFSDHDIDAFTKKRILKILDETIARLAEKEDKGAAARPAVPAKL